MIIYISVTINRKGLQLKENPEILHKIKITIIIFDISQMKHCQLLLTHIHLNFKLEIKMKKILVKTN